MVYGPFKAWISRVLLERQRRILSRDPAGRLPAVLIVAAKGVGTDFNGFLELVLNQDYPAYRILFVTQSAEDPAALAARSFLGLAPGCDRWVQPAGAWGGARDVEFVVSGLATDEGQKVHNQRAAFARLRPGDGIVAFADSDIVGSKEWLGQLLAPLNLGMADIASGYRWLIPKRDTLANRFASNINADVAMLSGPTWHTLLWGGSMAMTRDVFDWLDVPGLLKGSLNDDLQITRAGKEAGLRLLFVRGLMAPTPVDYNWAGFFEFARRQYFQVRVYVPGYWMLAFVLTSLWLAGITIAWTGVFRGDRCSIAMVGVALVCGLSTHFLRGWYLRGLFDEDVLQRLRGARSIVWCTATLNQLIHWCVVVSVAWAREMSWAGIRYRVTGRQRVKVLGREA